MSDATPPNGSRPHASGATGDGRSSTPPSPTLESGSPEPPLSKRARLLAVLGAIISGLYLVNPGAGLFELLPDAIPLVGNLDEAFFALLLAGSLRKLGINLPFGGEGNKRR